MGYPAPCRRALRRVARAAQHRRVGDVEWCTASGQRDDVVDVQVRRPVGGALVARAPVAVLAPPGPQHAGAEPLPGAGAVQVVVPAPVGLARVHRAATAGAARQDAADRAQLHPQIVCGVAGVVYSLGVLRLWGLKHHPVAPTCFAVAREDCGDEPLVAPGEVASTRNRRSGLKAEGRTASSRRGECHARDRPPARAPTSVPPAEPRARHASRVP